MVADECAAVVVVAQAKKRQLLHKFDEDEDNVRKVYKVSEGGTSQRGLVHAG